ncbi:MAG: AfsR/SARP family transcriptional regulator [Solirubrobacteraceae bacterium]
MPTLDPSPDSEPAASNGYTAGRRDAVIELALIGGFSLRIGPKQVELPLSAQRLVAFVALHPGQLRRTFVAGSLWTDASEQRAHARLRTAVWRCSRPDLPLLTSTSMHVGLDPRVTVDVRVISDLAEHELDERRGMDAGSDCDAATGTALSTVGQLLPDSYEDWLEFKREGLRQQCLHALEARAYRLCRDGRYGEALQAGLAAVASDPLRESAQRAVIATHLAAGNVVETVRQYRRFATRLQSDLGLTPTERLTSLLDAADVNHTLTEHRLSTLATDRLASPPR